MEKERFSAGRRQTLSGERERHSREEERDIVGTREKERDTVGRRSGTQSKEGQGHCREKESDTVVIRRGQCHEKESD